MYCRANLRDQVLLPIHEKFGCIAAPRLADLIMLQLRDENELANNIPTDETYRDTRVRIMREKLVRKGQLAFRSRLVRAYDGQCAITGCTISELIEATNLRPYAGAWHSRVCFGLLLKTDIHTLFDKGLLWCDNECRVYLAHAIMHTEYYMLHGKAIRLPRSPDDRPLKEHIT